MERQKHDPVQIANITQAMYATLDIHHCPRTTIQIHPVRQSRSYSSNVHNRILIVFSTHLCTFGVYLDCIRDIYSKAARVYKGNNAKHVIGWISKKSIAAFFIIIFTIPLGVLSNTPTHRKRAHSDIHFPQGPIMHES